MVQNIISNSKTLPLVQKDTPGFLYNSNQTQTFAGISQLTNSNKEILLKETLILIKGIARDILQAALYSLGSEPQQTISQSGNIEPAENTPGIESEEELDTEETNALSPQTSSPPRKNESLSSFLQRELMPNSQGKFHEEQLQYGIAAYLLAEKSAELLTQFKASFLNYKEQTGARYSYEDGTKIALRDLVSSNKLSKSEAEKINAQSFRAAQLDTELTSLYDDKGGPGDNTIATQESKLAAEKANRTLGRIRRGELKVTPRDLNAPSNTNNNSNISNISPSVANSTKGFLWKPVSESNGNLVVLIPETYSKNIESVEIYSKSKNGKEKLIEKGVFSGIANENRAHFRFKKPGDKYPDGVLVQIKLKTGETVSEVIKNTADRFEK